MKDVERYDGWAAGTWLLQQSILTESSTTAFLLETCILLPKLGQPRSTTYSLIISILSMILLPTSSGSTSSVPPPNSHILALRCLLALPHHLWDGQLREAEMNVIMEGLNGPDSTIRRLVRHLVEPKIQHAKCSLDAQPPLSTVP